MPDHQKQAKESPPAPRRIEDIEKIRDPAEMVREARKFIAYTRHREAQGIAARNEGIRKMRQSGLKPAEIARRTGENIPTIRGAGR